MTEFSTINLINLLEQIKEAIIKDELSVDDQEQLWDSINWGHNDPNNKDIVKYLFTGWWLHNYAVDPATENK